MKTLLEAARDRLLPVLLTAGSLIGFVAFAGAVIVWTRFYAVKVPPEQAVKAVPRDELVATGSSLLLIFGFFGVLAVLAMYLIDRAGRSTPGMSRGLLALVALEGVAATLIADTDSVAKTVLAMVLFLLPLGAIFAATFMGLFVRLEDTHDPCPLERLQPKREAGLFLGTSGEFRSEADVLVVVVGLGLAGVILIALAALLGHLSVAARVLLVLLAAYALTVAGLCAEDVAGGVVESVEQEEDVAERRPETTRLWKRRPYRLSLTLWGALLIGALTALAVILPSSVLGRAWPVISLGVAAILGFGLWRIAGLPKQSFMWFGLAVFLSVPLFGTLTLMARNLAEPQVQPMALIRNTDGPDEAIQGLYVTEADDRVYFADIATEGCGEEVAENSGRLLWVPKSEVVAMSIGPLQDIDKAARSALEMAYALTPAVETPAGDNVSLTVEEERSTNGGATMPAELGLQHDQRLENAGPAVRPGFGTGLRLVPEVASPGDVIALRMSNPNDEVNGFGTTPEGHTLRLGGVPLRVLREAVLDSEEAEYAKTADGRVIGLDKKGLYGERKLGDGQFHYSLEDHPGYEGTLWVKLEDSRIVDARSADEDDSATYLEVNAEGQLLHQPEVTLAQQASVPLEPVLLRQAWHEDEILFRVPEHAASGVLTVECGQLSGQPLLRVSRPPTARIAVRMQAGSRRIGFDGRRSSDDTGVALVRWTIGGLPSGRHARISRQLRPRLAPYRVRLTVTDSDGESDTAELHLLRLPASFFPFGEAKPERRPPPKRIQAAVVRAAREEPPAKIEVDGFADDVGSPTENTTLSIQRAKNVGNAILTPAAAANLGLADRVPVRTRGFGESCPLDRSGGRLRVNRRVEIFLLGEDTSIVTPPGCHASRTARDHW